MVPGTDTRLPKYPRCQKDPPSNAHRRKRCNANRHPRRTRWPNHMHHTNNRIIQTTRACIPTSPICQNEDQNRKPQRVGEEISCLLPLQTNLHRYKLCKTPARRIYKHPSSARVHTNCTPISPTLRSTFYKAVRQTLIACLRVWRMIVHGQSRSMPWWILSTLG